MFFLTDFLSKILSKAHRQLRFSKVNIFYFFACAWGIWLRLELLEDRGQNYEIDQAVILYEGIKAWTEGRFQILGSEFTHWEMLMSYLAGGVDLLGWNPQWVPFWLSLVEILLLGIFVARTIGCAWFFPGLALLMLNPWHLYYSSIVGTCVAAGVWILLSLLTPYSMSMSIGFRAFGLFHYSSTRIFIFAEFCWALFRREWRWVSISLGSFGCFFASVLLTQPEFFQHAIFRGGAQMKLPDYDFFWSPLRGLFFLWTPAFEKWVPWLQQNSDMEVSRALIEWLPPYELPLTWPGSILFSLGLWRLFNDTKIRGAILDLVLARLRFLLILSVFILSPVASFTHWLWMLPFLTWLMLLGVRDLKPLYSHGLLAGTLLWMGISSSLLLQKAAEGHPRDFFSARIPEAIRLMNAKVSANHIDSVLPRFIVSPHAFVEVRYWALKFDNLKVLFVQQPDLMAQQMRLSLQQANSPEQAKGREAWILIDRFSDPDARARNMPGVARLSAWTHDWTEFLRRHAMILEEVNLPGAVSESLLLKIRWQE